MKNYKLFNKIPIFDVVLVAVILLLGIFCINVFFSSDSGKSVSATKKQVIRITAEYVDVSSRIDCVPVAGEKVRDSATNTEIGTVVSAKSSPYVAITMDTITGQLVKTPCTDRQNVEIVIEASADMSDKGILINNINIGLGRTYSFTMPSVIGNCVVRNIEEVAV